MFNTHHQQHIDFNRIAHSTMIDDTFDQAFLDPVLFGDDQPQDALSFSSHGKTSSECSPTTSCSSFESEWETHVLSRKSIARLENTAPSSNSTMTKTHYIPPSQRNILNSPLDLDMNLCETPASLWETPMESPLTMYSGTPYVPPTPFYTPMIAQHSLDDTCATTMGKSPFIADEGYYTSQLSPFVAGFDGNPLSLINDKASLLAREHNQQIVYVGEQTSDISGNGNSLFVPLDDCMPDGNTVTNESQPSSQQSLFDVMDKHDLFSSQEEDQANESNDDEDYTPQSSETSYNKRKRSSSTRDATGRPLKRFECPLKGCGMRFSRRFNLQTHMRVHDPNRLKLFCCEVDGCHKNFDRRHDLTRHEATVHRGERAYHCEFCEKPFSRKDALVRHLTVKGCPQMPGAHRAM
jgi:hypothetical protein